MDTTFKEDIHKKLTEKGLAESSIKLYIRSLEKLNEDNPLKNLKFLSDPDKIIEKLSKYKQNTIRNYLIAIVSVLSLNKETKPGKKLYEAYTPLLLDKNKKLKAEESTNTKSETQEKNWLTQEQVEKVWEELKEKVDSFKSSKTVTESQYNILLQFMVLSLYVLIPPRRNEYMNMSVIRGMPQNDDTNYVDLDHNKLVFNKYKTARKEGKVSFDIPEKLQDVIAVYLKFHPLIKKTKKICIPFLVYYDGSPFSTVNAITRILNKVFKKRVSSSMLRHIYLSGRYAGITEEQKKDAEMMGHSVEMARDYVKV
jgi:integrase